KEDIFNALKAVAYENVKIVILGQDPYHEPNQAHGLSFSVNVGVVIPPSLLNIYKELKNEMNCYIPDNGYLQKWANQGVLLLNTCLTVRKGLANSHQKMGWEIFTDNVIMELNRREKPICFMLWGNNAKSKISLITNKQHLILSAAHPSPLSATRGFFGCNHFLKANAFLQENGHKPIDWQIENVK
ncbi:MAG: uracil-DNA glycosylase, partial [Clostridia bacterium]